MRIGIDLMGSESSPSILFEGITQAAEELHDVTFIVFATQSTIDSILAQSTFSQPNPRIIFHVVTEVVEMADEPIVAIR